MNMYAIPAAIRLMFPAGWAMIPLLKHARSAEIAPGKCFLRDSVWVSAVKGFILPTRGKKSPEHPLPPEPVLRRRIRAEALAAVPVQPAPMTKKPKFFCEYCNNEVRQDAIMCPHCGRFFSSVRCPECGFTGTHKEFKNGCPECGYAFNKSTPLPETKPASKRKKGVKKKKKICGMRSDEDPLPLWIYGLVLCLAALIGVIFVSL